MTRRYTRETASEAIRVSEAYIVVRMVDGTTYEGRTLRRKQVMSDATAAKYLPLLVARGEVTPVPVDLKREAAKFARGKR